MLLIYTPDDADKQAISFRPGKLLSVEAEMIEDVGGPAWDSFEEFGRKFMAGNRKAYRAALWIMLRRSTPRLKFGDLDLRVDQLEVDFEDDEKSRMRTALENAQDLDDDERAELLATLDEPPPGKDDQGADATDSS